MFLRQFWYAAALGGEVGRQPLARTILGEPVLLYRKLDGSVAALEDRCSHRRVSLSRGRLVEDKVQCGYHGIMFDADGACVSIPGQELIPPQANIRCYPVVERDGFVWIWTADPAIADPAKLPDYSLCSSYAGRTDRMHIAADYLLSIDNIMDLSHIAYVHQAYANDVGAAIRPSVKTEGQRVTVTRVMKDIENPPLYKRVIGTGHVDRVQELRFTPGGHLQLYVTIRPAGAGEDARTLHVFYFSQLTPETERSHHTFFGVYRDFEIESAELTKLLGDQTVITVSEDKAVIEDQQRNWDRDGAGRPMIDIAVDRGPLEARRLIRRLHDQERQSSAVAAAE